MALAPISQMNPIPPYFPPPLPATYHMPLPVQCPHVPRKVAQHHFTPWARNTPLADGSKPRTIDRVPEATTCGLAISIPPPNKVRCGAWNI